MSIIRRNKNYSNIPDFDDMMSEVEEELEVQQAEQEIVDRVPELKKLSENIDKATNNWLNATYELESAIQQYQRAEQKLNAAVDSIGIKVDTINTHIDNVLKDAPSKLQISVNVSDADWQKIQDKFGQERKWMLDQMQEHTRKVNDMLIQERKNARNRYKEYDGCYLGHYVQWFVWFFFTIGISVVSGGLAMLIAQYYGK